MTSTAEPSPAIRCNGCGHLIGRHAVHYLPTGAVVLCAGCWRAAGQPNVRWCATRSDAARLLGVRR